mmetsp:Transcript_75765/g.190540  ORF Transcript_75765/g.190540 Transcript_75765/m.190540 type:complete len:368 (-) Transcript_75765:90-1193(-)
MQVSRIWLLIVLSFLHVAGSARLRPAAKTGKYLIASFPGYRQINYVRLPERIWRPLVVSGLGKPELISVDIAKHRLFVVDVLTSTLVWYQLRMLPSGRLMTDGHQHVILQSFVVRGLALDAMGSLYIAGRRVPPEPEMPFEGIFKLEATALDASVAGGFLLEPMPVWTRNNSVALNAPASPRLNEPSGLAVDPLHMFWGNAVVRDGATGAIVKAAVTPSAQQPGESLAVLDAGTEGVTCLAATPAYLFYVISNKIYGVPKDVSGQPCGEGAGSCGVEVGPQKLNVTLDLKMIVYDGEGTIYTTDHRNGAVYSFTAGTINKHYLAKVADALDVWGLAVYSEVSAAAATVLAPGALALVLIWAGLAGSG